MSRSISALGAVSLLFLLASCDMIMPPSEPEPEVQTDGAEANPDEPVIEEAANEPSGPFQAAVGSSVASLAFLQDDDD